MTNLKIREAMELGIEAHKEGNLQDAERYYISILETQPNHPDANHNLGVLSVDAGKAEQALPFFVKALKANYSIEQFWVSFIDALIKLERFDDAKKALRQAREKGVTSKSLDAIEHKLLNDRNAIGLKPEGPSENSNPPQADLQPLINLYKLGQFSQVVSQAAIQIRKYPNSFFLHNICGTSYLALKQYTQALESYERAARIKPNYADVYNNMGVALRSLGNLSGAIESYKKALRINPKYASAYGNMGVAQRDKGDLDSAIDSFKRALEIAPNQLEIYTSLGNALRSKGDLEAAVDTYKKAIKVQSDNVQAYANIAEAYEKWNKVEELSKWMKRAEEVFTKLPPDLAFHKCQVLFRQKKYDEANEAIKGIEISSIRRSQQRTFLEIQGKCAEKLGDFDSSFQFFDELNTLVKNDGKFTSFRPEEFFKNQQAKLFILKHKNYKAPPNDLDKQKGFIPNFLIGFPRSGTTLLDTILRSHSLIEVVEEEPALPSALSAFRKIGDYDLIEEFPSEADRARIRNIYSDEFGKYVHDLNSDALKIDKLPLNILNIHLSHWLFPGAKYILALRHPLDSILSCWMQNFELNAAMANMVDLDRIVDLYCVSMEMCKVSEEKFGLDIHRLKYENLVSDMEGEVTKLLDFLNLEWEENLRGYQNTAINRGRINTPSYAQVVQPLYTDATYRWKNYEKHLEKFFPKIAPWVSEFGYEPLT